MTMNSKFKNIFKNYILSRPQKHKFHIVSASPWPFCTALSAFILVISLVSWMYGLSKFMLIIGLLSIFFSMFVWFRDIIREGLFVGYHTTKVKLNLRLGFTLFILTEIMFFFGFFWSWFHFSVCPSTLGGNVWPPSGICQTILFEDLNRVDFSSPENCNYYLEFRNYFDEFFDRNFYYPVTFSHNWKFDFLPTVNHPTIKFTYDDFYRVVSLELTESTGEKQIEFFDVPQSSIYLHLYSKEMLVNPFGIPLLNTIILLASGAVLTYSHASLKVERYLWAFLSLVLTILLGIFFIILQFLEYKDNLFQINDGIYGSLFYLLTGFHGIHVIIGTIFLIVCLIRLSLRHFTPANHFGFEAAIWYWHFVDVIWIILFFVVYYWPNISFFSPINFNGDINEALMVAELQINLDVDYLLTYYNLNSQLLKNIHTSPANQYYLKSLSLLCVRDDYFNWLNKFFQNEFQ